MNNLLSILILSIIVLFGCIDREREDVIHLSVCNEFPECFEVIDSLKGFGALKCNQNASPFATPCFNDSTRDTINFRFSNPQKSFIKLELMDNSERVIKVFINDTLQPGYYTCPWYNKRDGEIYGCRMFSKENAITYWFFAE